MRQAGRYLPGYRAVRSRVGFLELCRRPDLSVEVSLEPVARFGVDAAIVFSDILLPLEAMGQTVTFDDRGPLIEDPVRGRDDVARLRPFDPSAGTPWILETISALQAALPPETPVIGFAGAPFTLAAYAVEGRVTKALRHAVGMRFADPASFQSLLNTFADATVPYLVAQARAGARVLQLFDTWAGQLSREDFRTFELPALRRVFDGVHEALGDECPPLVLFSRGTGAWLELLPECGADAFSVDWRVPLGEAQDRLGGRPVQGNLDPRALFGPAEAVRAETRKMLDAVAGRSGIVANLGHGVIVGTPPESVGAFVAEVQGR